MLSVFLRAACLDNSWQCFIVYSFLMGYIQTRLEYDYSFFIDYSLEDSNFTTQNDLNVPADFSLKMLEDESLVIFFFYAPKPNASLDQLLNIAR